jgi:hypothetical protein
MNPLLQHDRCRVAHDGLADAICLAECGRVARRPAEPAPTSERLLDESSDRVGEPNRRDQMSKAKQEGKVEVPDQVEKATMAVLRAVGRLVKLLGHGDDLVVEAAAGALAALGGQAIVGPLATTLLRSTSPRQRAWIVAMMATLGLEERSFVLTALFAAKKRERDVHVAGLIQGALMALMMADPNSPQGPTQPTMTARE